MDIASLSSKVLGYYLVFTGLTLKLPQIRLLWRNKSAEGISFSSYLLETLATMIVIGYSVRHAYAFNTYGESWFILAQNWVIMMLTIYLNPSASSIQLWGFAAGASALFGVLLHESFPEWALELLQMWAVPFFISSKFPQIWKNYQLKTTGQLSAYVVVNNFIGTSIRLYTTYMEVDSAVVFYGYLTSTILNAIIGLQMVAYYGNNNVKDKKVE